MLKYGEYCDACQAALTVIKSSDTALKSFLEWLTMSYAISDSVYLIFSAVLQADSTWVSLQMYYLATLYDDQGCGVGVGISQKNSDNYSVRSAI